MSLRPVTLRNATDTSTNEARTSDNYSKSDVLRLRSGSGTTNYAWVYFTRPFPLGAVIVSATMKFKVAQTWGAAASRTFEADRVLDQWKVGRLQWSGGGNGNPSVAGSPIACNEVVTGSVADGTWLTFNVQPLLQLVADAAVPWWGVRLRITNDTTLRRLWSAQAATGKPVLQVTYALPPNEPTGGNPSGGQVVTVALPIARYEFSDPDGSGQLAMQQVQMDALGLTESPSFSSAPMATDKPRVDLSALVGETVVIPNGTFDVNATGWSGTGGTPARVTTPVRSGAGALSLTSSAGGTMSVRTPTGLSGIPVVGGRRYTWQVYTRHGTVARSTSIKVEWYDAAGASLSTSAGTASNTTTSYVVRTVTANAPATAAFASVIMEVTSTAASDVVYFDDVTAAGTTVDSNHPAYPASGGTTNWRVRNQDVSGAWGPWSDWFAYKFQTYAGALTVTNPSSGTPTVTESTPPIIWTVGYTQRAYQVIVTDVTAGVTPKVLYDSGALLGSTTSHTLPERDPATGARVIKSTTKTYNVEVRSWDNEDRAPGVNYLSVNRDFTFVPSAATTGVSALTVTDLTPAPGAQLDFTRATAPDFFELVRDGDAVGGLIDPVDALVSGTSYRITDWGATPRHSHTWNVRAVVNGVASLNGTGVTDTLDPIGIWLIDPVANTRVMLLDKDTGSWSMQEASETKWALGATRPTKVVQTLAGYVGTLSGRLIEYAGVTHDQALAVVTAMKAKSTRTYRLVVADLNIPVLLSNIVPGPTASAEMEKVVTFDFVQDGELTYDPEV